MKIQLNVIIIHNTTYKSLFTDHALKHLIATKFWKIKLSVLLCDATWIYFRTH